MGVSGDYVEQLRKDIIRRSESGVTLTIKPGRDVSRRALLLGVLAFPLIDLGVIARSENRVYIVGGLISVGYASSLLQSKVEDRSLWAKIYDATVETIRRYAGNGVDPEALAQRLLGAPREAGQAELERRVREKLEILSRHGLTVKRRVGELISAGSPADAGVEVKGCDTSECASEALRAAALSMLEAEGTPQAAPVAYIINAAMESEWDAMYQRSVKKLAQDLESTLGISGDELRRATIELIDATLQVIAEPYRKAEREGALMVEVKATTAQPRTRPAEVRGMEWPELEELARAIVAAELDDKLPLQRVLPVLLAASRYRPANTATLEEYLRRLGPHSDRLAGSKATLYRLVERLKQKGLLTQKPPIQPTEKAETLLTKIKEALEAWEKERVHTATG